MLLFKGLNNQEVSRDEAALELLKGYVLSSAGITGRGYELATTIQLGDGWGVSGVMGGRERDGGIVGRTEVEVR